MSIFRTARKYRHNWAPFNRLVISPDHPLGPLMIRYRLVRLPRFGVFVHRILRPDADSDLHDHPWPFVTAILRGGYAEERATVGRQAPGRTATALPGRTWRPGTLHRMPLTVAHRITSVLPGTWTLALVGRRRQDWGFWTEDGWMPWPEYERLHPARAAAPLGPDPFNS